MATCLNMEVSNTLHKKGWGERQMFLIFFELFSTIFYVLLWKKRHLYSYNVQQPPTETGIPLEISTGLSAT